METLVSPRLHLLTAEQVAFIHARSLEVLSRTGIRVDSPRALEILRSADGVRPPEGSSDGESRVAFDPELVEWAIGEAPPAVDVYDREGEPAFRLGEGRTRFGLGATNLFYQDPANDTLERFSREHMAVSTRLGHGLAHVDLISTIGVVQDYPPGRADLYATLEMVANTTKPLVLLVSAHSLFSPALDLLETLTPGLEERPYLVPYLNPVTPLIINEGTAEKLLATVERGLPVIYSNYSMAGMSTPISAAGTLILLNAELLAGLVLAQLIRPGAPVILGSLPAYFDMKTLQDFFDPHSMLLNQACAEMMAHYRVPHAGTSGSGIGWGTDLAAGGQIWMNHLMSLLGSSGMAPFVGGNLGSKAFSPTLAVYSDDVIGQAVRLSEGFALSDGELDMDTILSKGPGGSFLNSELTLGSFRDAYYESVLMPRLGLEEWETRGRPRYEELLREYTVELLEAQAPPDDHDDLIARGEAFIEEVE